MLEAANEINARARGTGPILLVEDAEDDFFIFRRALERAEIRRRLMRVRDGEEAIQYLKGDAPYADRTQYPIPDLLVLDLKMPIRDGFEVLEWLRGQPALAEIPVVVWTGSDWKKDQSRAEEFPIIAYHLKPLEFERMVELVRKFKD
ncbi:MAG TPA: response regulator [Candidatus Dormibacteraeota bacterium]|nr:response regulator [Candidatus Dormibacteraeota bacterium]